MLYSKKEVLDIAHRITACVGKKTIKFNGEYVDVAYDKKSLNKKLYVFNVIPEQYVESEVLSHNVIKYIGYPYRETILLDDGTVCDIPSKEVLDTEAREMHADSGKIITICYDEAHVWDVESGVHYKLCDGNISDVRVLSGHYDLFAVIIDGCIRIYGTHNGKYQLWKNNSLYYRKFTDYGFITDTGYTRGLYHVDIGRQPKRVFKYKGYDMVLVDGDLFMIKVTEHEYFGIHIAHDYYIHDADVVNDTIVVEDKNGASGIILEMDEELEEIGRIE